MTNEQLARALTTHATNALNHAIAVADDEEIDDACDAINRELMLIDALDDESRPTPLLFKVCILWCELTLEFAPRYQCSNPDHNHGTSFKLAHAVTGEEFDVDSVSAPTRWASRFLLAAREGDTDNVMALWQSIPDADAYTRNIVQLAMMVGIMIKKHQHKLIL